MSNKQYRLLITGSTHSGKNWAANILTHFVNCEGDHEPMHSWSPPGIVLRKKKPGFIYCDNESDPAKIKLLDSCFFGIGSIFNSLIVPKGVLKLRSLKVSILRWLRYHGRRSVLIKDPYSLYAVEWLNKKHHVKPWIILRDPLSYVAVMVAENTPFDIPLHLEDPEFLKAMDALDSIRLMDARSPGADSLLLSNIHRWIFAALQVRKLANRYKQDPDWAFSLLEEINKDQVTMLSTILPRLGIAATPDKIREAIEKVENGARSERLKSLNLQSEMMRVTTKSSPALSPEEICVIRSMTQTLYDEIRAILGFSPQELILPN